MDKMYLKTIPPQYEAFLSEHPDLSFCRVIQQEKDLYQIVGLAGTRQARVSGRFQYDVKSVSDFPAVGDYVMADLSGDPAVIHTVLPRKSVFLRKAAGSAKTEPKGRISCRRA